jgi:oligopeptidase B
LASVAAAAAPAAAAAAATALTQFARVAVLDVPFLDVVNTMRDPQLPLTIKERSEWGDPLNDQVRSSAVSLRVSQSR